MASTHKGHSDSYWTSKMKELATGKPFWRGERPIGKAPSGILYPKKSRGAPITETLATWMCWGGPSDAPVAITSQGLLPHQ